MSTEEKEKLARYEATLDKLFNDEHISYRHWKEVRDALYPEIGENELLAATPRRSALIPIDDQLRVRYDQPVKSVHDPTGVRLSISSLESLEKMKVRADENFPIKEKQTVDYICPTNPSKVVRKQPVSEEELKRTVEGMVPKEPDFIEEKCEKCDGSGYQWIGNRNRTESCPPCYGIGKIYRQKTEDKEERRKLLASFIPQADRKALKGCIQTLVSETPRTSHPFYKEWDEYVIKCEKENRTPITFTDYCVEKGEG